MADIQLLAVQRPSSISTDAIVEVLWGEAAPAGAAQNVASLVSRLRRVLGVERTGAQADHTAALELVRLLGDDALEVLSTRA